MTDLINDHDFEVYSILYKDLYGCKPRRTPTVAQYKDLCRRHDDYMTNEHPKLRAAWQKKVDDTFGPGHTMDTLDKIAMDPNHPDSDKATDLMIECPC